jgi:hypothetical protein
MGRFAAVLTSILASLGLAGIVTDDDGPGDAPRPPADVKTTTQSKVEVRVIETRGNEDDDPALVLREAYDTILRLKAERLEDRPRELLDRAVELYKQAVAAYGREGEGHEREARGLAIAARELARAVERLRDAQRTGRTDPDLPPPPAPRRATTTIREVRPPVLPAWPLPPPLPSGDGPVPPALPAPPAPPAPPTRTLEAKFYSPEIHSYVLTRPGPDGKVEIPAGLRGRVFVTPNGDVLKKAEGLAKVQRYEVRVEGKDLAEPIRKQVEEARQQAEAARGQAARAQDEARKAMEKAVREGMKGDQAKAFETARGLAEQLARGMRADPAAKAREDLQRAYDKIAAARKAAGDDPKGKYYLDAARDLYNAARRDAEAGRHERASELARAAEALTLVPQNLPAGVTREGPYTNMREARIQELHVIPKSEYKVAVPVEIAPRSAKEEQASPDDEPKAKPEASEDEDETEIEGIGAALGVEDGKVVVRDLVPGGPAARDDRLKAGDVLVGVRKEGDETFDFEGKELKEIVESLRGKAGSSVAILVKPKDRDETVTYELKRAKVPVPARPTEEAKPEGEGEGRPLPPALPED